MTDYELVIVAESAGQTVESWAGLGFRSPADAEQYLTVCLRGDVLPGFGRIQVAYVNRVDLTELRARPVASWSPAEGWSPADCVRVPDREPLSPAVSAVWDAAQNGEPVEW